MNMNQNNSVFMEDGDLLYTILADLKRTVREYTTATTESACPTIRTLFTQLTNETLTMQGELYNLMKQLNMYSTSSSALRQDLDKQIQDAKNTMQKTTQFVQQKISSIGNGNYNPSFHIPNQQNTQQNHTIN